MKLCLTGHDSRYAIEQLQLSLFPDEPVVVVDTPPAPGEEGAESRLYTGPVWLTAVTTMTRGGQTHRVERRLRQTADERLRRRLLQNCYYDCALHFLPQAPAWGALSGVRPTKLATAALQRGCTRAQAEAELRRVYRVSPPRARLAVDCGEASVRALAAASPEELSVYVGIPFCPSRCVYCSFISRAATGGALADYLDALLAELDYTGQLLRQSGHRVRTVYFGGGTPTTLSTPQLERLMTALGEQIDLSACREYTVEAGRPDTLDGDKLALLRRMGAGRVSINPQSMDDRVLALAGRKHTAAMVVEAVGQARAAGFDEINMDLIAGLPGDSAAGFARSLAAVIALRPENITVHTLALKKAAALYDNDHRGQLPPVEAVAEMVEHAWQTLRAAGYVPYYLYRQKYMSGSFENIGWCIPGHECLYNIDMMEEQQSILALGGGGVTKLVQGGRITRWNAPKDPAQYITRPAELRRKKDEFFAALADPAR